MKRYITLALTVVLPLVVVLAVVLEHYGVFDRWLGIDQVEKVSDRFNHSYTPDASAPVYPGDAEWKPTLNLIEKYSKQKLRADKQPATIARFTASLSTKDTYAGTEWTAPSTPFAVIYEHWPRNAGVDIPKEDFTIVGTIGDLQSWIAQSKAEFHFRLIDVSLAVLAAVLASWLWVKEPGPHRAPRVAP